jgi:hypothetical protein
MENPLLGLLAERLKQAQGFAAKPFGYSNPPAEMLMKLEPRITTQRFSKLLCNFTNQLI